MRAILPKPPSTNHIYKFTSQGGFARSYISKNGNDWFEEAGWQLRTQIKPFLRHKEPLKLVIDEFFIRGDIDGVLKPILDLFQKTGLIENDSQIVELHVQKFTVHHRAEEHVVIELSPLTATL